MAETPGILELKAGFGIETRHDTNAENKDRNNLTGKKSLLTGG